MDNAYLHGFDYDSHRQGFRTTGYDESFFALADTQRIGRKRKFIVYSTLIVLVVLSLFIFALRYIPLFDIDGVSFSISGGLSTIPVEAQVASDAIIGKSLMSGAPRKLEQQLSNIPLVEKVRVRRNLFSKLTIDLHVAQPAVFIAAITSSDTVDSIYIIEEGKLQAIALEDFQAFGNRVFVIEVGTNYAKHLQQYGVDAGLEHAMALASEMGMDEDGRYRIIGRITYNESFGDAFGNMVLDMPAYNSKLYIREVVSESRLHDAVRLIKLEHEHDWTRNIALIGQLRYDLYAQSLVSRH